MSKIDEIKEKYYIVIICVAVIATTASVTTWFYNRQLDIITEKINLIKEQKNNEIKNLKDQLNDFKNQNNKLIEENISIKKRLDEKNNKPKQLAEKHKVNEKDMTIYAAQSWQSTGFIIKRGDKINLLIRGEIRYSDRKTAPGRGRAGPEGVPPVSPPRDGDTNDFRKYSVVPDWNHCAVIGKIGENIFLVGQEINFTSNYEGKLYLRINDKDTENNSGTLQAKIFHEIM